MSEIHKNNPNEIINSKIDISKEVSIAEEFVLHLESRVHDIRAYQKSISKNTQEYVNLTNSMLDYETQLSVVRRLIKHVESSIEVGKPELFIQELVEVNRRFYANWHIETDRLIEIQNISKSRLSELKVNVRDLDDTSVKVEREPPQRREVISEVPKDQLIVEAADFIFSFENFRANPYWDYAQWSRGYGTKVPWSINDEKTNPWWTINEQEAKKAKYSHIEADYNKVSQYFWFDPMTKNQKIAILSFVYNNWRHIFEVEKWAKNLQAVFFNPNSSIDDKIKAMMPFHYAKWESLEWLRKRRAGEAILARKKEEWKRENIDMMVMADNEKPWETVSVIYWEDTLWRTITRAIDRINNNPDESDSSTLATRLAEFNPDFNTIHSWDKVYTKKKTYNNVDYYEITFEEYSFIVRWEDAYSMSTSLDEILNAETTKEITALVPQGELVFYVPEKASPGQVVANVFPSVYPSGSAYPQLKAANINLVVNQWDPVYRDGAYIIINNTKIKVNNDWTIELP